MGEIEVNKLVITITNIAILAGLPCMLTWHIRQAKKQVHMSNDWVVQILIIFAYMVAIGAEIPALWARWKAYYVYKMDIPDSLYVLSTWDRYNHLFFYVIFFILTYSFTRKKVPNIIRDTLS
jgi:hypothetical protein